MTTSRFAPTGIRYCFDPAADTTPMANRSAGLAGLLRMTGAVAEAGLAPPEAFIVMRDRFQAFSTAAAGGAPTMMERLVASLRDGAGDPALWFACCVAEAGAGAIERRAEVLSEVHAAMEGAQRDLYAPTAPAHNRTLAQRFDKAGQGFMGAADIPDPGADPGVVVNAGDRKLKAWRDAAAFANQLDQLLPALAAAAELVRPVTMPTGLGVSRDVFTLPLVADVGDTHKRVAWASWMDWPEPKPVTTVLTIEAMTAPPDQPIGTRCGRWTRLWRIDADIRAHPDPASLALFGQPQPIAIRDQVPVGNRGTVQRFDPEGPLPAEAPKRRRLRDMFRRTPDEAPPAEPDLADTFSDGEER